MATISRLLAALLLLAVLAAGCGADEDDDDAPMTGDDVPADPTDPAVDPADPFGTAEWRLVEATVDGTDLELIASHPITLQRRGDEVTGTAACNGYSGAIVGGATLFEGFAVTEMACDPPETMALESLFLQALGRVDTAVVEDDPGGSGMLVLSGDGVELRFEQVAPTPDADLEGTQWMLDTLLDADAARSTLGDTAAGLRLDAGRITGTDGCNTFEGAYELDGDTLRVGSLAQTTRGCAPEVLEQARTIMSVLTGDPAVTLDGDRLTLRTGSGLGLVYRAA